MCGCGWGGGGGGVGGVICIRTYLCLGGGEVT